MSFNPMKINFVDLKKNYESIKDQIQKNVDTLFDRCDFIHGKGVHDFEEAFRSYIGLNHFMGCANGTDALEVAIQTLGLKPEDEVIVQGNTYIATCLGVLNNKVKLVLADMDPSTFQISLNDVKSKITSKTKALIVVHLYGLVSDMDAVCDLVKEHNLFLIEDCAQSHGAEWKGKKAGTFGDISCFSFYPGKNLGAYGDGGGIGTNSADLDAKMRLICNLGCKVKYQHEVIGRNSRLDTLQALFLNTKLEHLDTWNKLRRFNADYYKKQLKDIGDIILPSTLQESLPVWHLFVIRTNFRDELKAFLEKRGIQVLIHYPISIVETEAMEQFGFDKESLKNCVESSKTILSLPMYPELETFEIDYICKGIKDFFLEKSMCLIKTIRVEDKNGDLHCMNNFHFDVKRFFYVNNFDLENKSPVRGLHANVTFNELMVILSGSVKVTLTEKDGITKKEKLVKANETCFIPKMRWIEYEILEANTVVLVFADQAIEDSVSERNFEKFCQM
jgi:dTDP-4-amino-4,6-dideoxygalactose transaminase